MNVNCIIDKRKFPTLENAIFSRGIKKKVIADTLGITPKTLSNKLSGKCEFTWEEVLKLKTNFFPDVDTEQLMCKK